MSSAPPLRFIGVLLGGWVCARATVFAPEWLSEEVKASEAPRPSTPTAAAMPATSVPAIGPPPCQSCGAEVQLERAQAPAPAAHPRPVQLAIDLSSGQIAPVAPIAAAAEPLGVGGPMEPAAVSVPVAPPLAPQPIAAMLATGPDRLAISGWALVRQGSGSQLATGGVLGGSQVGARATYRLTRSVALSGRVSSPLEGDGAEAAVGVEWQPLPEVPVKLLAERRQAIGDKGRSAFALLAHGGVSGAKIAGPVVADAYAQAGVVGARERDLFADGAVKLSAPVGSGISAGAGTWGAAQPGVSRLDVGPQVAMELPGGGVSLRVSAEWRVRVAGDAEPGSGPAITVATDF